MSTSFPLPPSVNPGVPLFDSYTCHSIPLDTPSITDITNHEWDSRDGGGGSGEKAERERRTGQDWIMGIDEAGRGPVLGPMVYAVAYCPVSCSDTLKELGFTDSKALTHTRRIQLFDLILRPRPRSNSSGESRGEVYTERAAEVHKSVHWAARVMSPKDVSNGMLRRNAYNLNAQSHNATISLIQEVLKRGFNITEVFVDTVGPTTSYAALLSSHFPSLKFTVASKADATFPVTGAASVVAKVTRDRCLEVLASDYVMPPERGDGGDEGGTDAGEVGVKVDGQEQEEEQQQEEEEEEEEEQEVKGKRKRGKGGKASAKGKSKKAKQEAQDGEDGEEAEDTGISKELGSGYPGDPRTIAYLQSSIDPVFGYDTGLVRFSWQTVKTLLDQKAHQSKWADDMPTIQKWFQPANVDPALAPLPFWKGMSLSSVSSL